MDSSSPPVDAYPFSGNLIRGSDAAAWIEASLLSTESEVSLCSAFLRADAVEVLLSRRKAKVTGRVLVRWQLRDLISGASDLKAYEALKAVGLTLSLRLDFHGKVFSIPDRGIVVGSANATLSGLGFSANPNEEVCTQVPASPANLSLIDGLFSGSVPVTDVLYAELKEAFEGLAQVNKAQPVAWPEPLMKKLLVPPPVERLLLDECFWSSPRLTNSGHIEATTEHERELLGLSLMTFASDEIADALKQTRMYRWLEGQLIAAGGELYFGELTSALHTSLLDDPVALRSRVKNILQHLLAWCEIAPGSGILVDRPRFSQRARLATS